MAYENNIFILSELKTLNNFFDAKLFYLMYLPNITIII